MAIIRISDPSVLHNHAVCLCPDLADCAHYLMWRTAECNSFFPLSSDLPGVLQGRHITTDPTD